MAVTAYASGTWNNLATEQFVNVNQAGTFTFHIDPTAMVAGDVVELRAYQIILTGGTAKVVYLKILDGAQPTDGMIQVSDPLGNELTDANSLRFSSKQTFGTAHDIIYKVLKYA
jgi:hypothetical protein